MEKLYRVVCANYAIDKRKPLRCALKFEDSIDEALIMFVGIGMQSNRINSICEYIGIDIETAHTYQERFSKKKGFRFGVKLGLIQNGMRL